MKTTIQTRSRVLAVILSARLLLAATLLATVAFTSGCVAVVAAGAAGGAVAWVRGAVVTSLDGDLDRVYRASQQAVADLQFARISERKSGVDAEIKSRTALDKKDVIVQIAEAFVAEMSAQPVKAQAKPKASAAKSKPKKPAAKPAARRKKR